MNKPIVIHSEDKWNKIQVEMKGSKIIVSEISSYWGEETHTFLSRPALMEWVQRRFTEEQFAGSEEERQQVIEKFKQI